MQDFAQAGLGGCEVMWSGGDFTACFKERVLDNLPLLVVGIGSLYLLATSLDSLYRLRHPRAPVTAASLTSPTGDSDLSKLESHVIISAVGSNLLPDSKERLRTKEAEEVIADLKRGNGTTVDRYERAARLVGVVGGLAYMGVGIAGAVVEHRYKDLAFPIFIGLASLFPSPPLASLVSLHLIPTLLLFGSTLFSPHPPPMRIAPTVVELVYWAVLISIPYGGSMDRLLAGSKSRGGGSLGSFGSKLDAHIEEPTSAFSRATFAFMIPLLLKYYRTPITLEKIPAIREDDSAASMLGAFRADQAYYDARYAKKHGGARRRRNLGVNLLRFFLPDLLAQCVWAILFICLQYLQPTGLRLLLQFVKNRDAVGTSGNIAYVYIAMMAGGQCFGIMAMGQCLYMGRRVGVRLRSIVISEVFTKALRRQDLAGSVKKSVDKDGKPVDAGANDGKISNFISNDAFNMSEICGYSFYLVSCPFAVILNCVLLFNTLGVASLAGMAVILLLIPLQGTIGRIYAIVQRRYMGATDARLEAVTEVISHIKLIKFNAWERKFFDRMSVTRKTELSILAQKMAISVLQQVVVWGTPVIVTAAAFAVHSVVLHQPLTADRAFASLILFNMLRDPLALFQDTFVRLLQSYTSCTRIQAYLEEPDTPKYKQLSRAGPNEPRIGFKGALVGYMNAEDSKNAEFEPFRLGELNLDFPSGALSMVVGPVGSGKTTLVMSLLGETSLLSGKIFMPDDHANRDACPVDPETGLSDTVAYCSQTAWLIGATIRENITFGTPWNRKRYDAVVDACALRRDFEIFELGDLTEVGEKGTTCSGGQKARIALARALYSTAGTIILDDVLSAVDAQTARHIYVHCLQGKLTKGRTVILVTHAVSLVAPAASFVVMLDAGSVVASGPPAELIASGLLEVSEEAEAGANSSASTLVPDSPKDIIEDNLDGIEADALETKKHVDAEEAEALATDMGDTKPVDVVGKQLVGTETQGQGSIAFATYLLYFRAMGSLPFWVVLSTALASAQILQIANNAWIKDWANSSDAAARSTSVLGRFFVLRGEVQGYAASLVQGHETLWYLGIYCAISATYLFAIAARVGINYLGSLHASRVLYDRLLRRILGAKMRFFDATPSGRIINRLSKDMFSVDSETGEILMYFANCILSVMSVLAVILFSTPAGSTSLTTSVFIFALVGIAMLYWVVGSLYVTTSREIKRFDAVTRSPIFISFSEVLVGMSTIRSYGDSARFTRKLFDEIDQNTRCFWYLWQANRVLHNFSNFAGSIVTITASVFALQNRNMDAGAVGLSITYALSFTDFVLWIVRMYAACEMSMNSVERVGEYLNLEVEEEDHKRGIEPPAYWPSREGKVVVEGLTCKYAPQLEPVLRGVSFEIGPSEKIGICGRTGSGKSTLALSFFRFLHQESGSIVIDGLDVSKISLATLRSRLTILPQEAQLFSGTIRENLDPFGEHEDADIWDALSRCGLSGKTPGGSRAATRPASRNASKVDLRSLAGKDGDVKHPAPHKDGDLRHSTLSKSVAAKLASVKAGDRVMISPAERLASEANGHGHEDETEDGEEGGVIEVEERVTIRSLDEKVAVGGKNFSQGQRQLLALARGLLKLRHSSFLIMDESTANLDHATDQTIQNVLRTGLAETQMLVIAHRLMTVCGLDKILVLDHGKVVEFGTPWELMQKEDGSFRDLCRQSGEEAQLLELARHVHESKERRDSR